MFDQRYDDFCRDDDALVDIIEIFPLRLADHNGDREAAIDSLREDAARPIPEWVLITIRNNYAD